MHLLNDVLSNAYVNFPGKSWHILLAEAWRHRDVSNVIDLHFSISPNSIQIVVRIDFGWNASHVQSLKMKLLLKRENYGSISINFIKLEGVWRGHHKESQRHICVCVSMWPSAEPSRKVQSNEAISRRARCAVLLQWLQFSKRHVVSN